MKTFISTAVKASVVSSLLSASVSASASANFYEDDADFVSAVSAVSSGAWGASASNQTGTATSFEECSVPGVCRSYKVTGGNFTAVITNNLTGVTIQVPMGETFEAPVLYVKNGAIAAGIEYTITADVGQWSHFCYPQAQTLSFQPADSSREIHLDIPCE